jgi:hypothetical protein
VAHRINAETPEQAGLMTRIYQKTKVLSRGSVLLEKDGDDGHDPGASQFLRRRKPEYRRTDAGL